MFRDGIREFAERLEESEVPTHAIEEPGMFHVFPILMPWAERRSGCSGAMHELAKGHVASDPDATQTH